MFQLGSALLDGCVLGVLARGDAYGYRLTAEIKQVIDVSESTLYPVLRRLQKDGLLLTYDQAYNGRNRRYYRVTDPGRARLGAITGSWQTFKHSVDVLLEGVGNAHTDFTAAATVTDTPANAAADTEREPVHE